MQESLEPSKFEKQNLPFKVKRLSPSIGAELLNIDLTKNLSKEIIQLIYEALLIYKVIFFRKQVINTKDHIRFANYFGDLEVHPFGANNPDYPEVLSIVRDKRNKGKENVWHSDVTWRKEPSLGSILRMLKCPKNGGDTLFADMGAAYNDLPDQVKEKLVGAVAIHDFTTFRYRMIKEGKTKDEIESFNMMYPKPEHPVIRTHPGTGQKTIYVNVAFTQEIKGWNKQESEEMLKYLYSRSSIPEYQCRFKWKKNSIAFWDNRACQHYAVQDYFPQNRAVERVTIKGNKPY
ncbi:MAG: TauD/TfdA family dioxygenase [SAR86 cluster bacterium]|jgi:taurine dioxygenase|nr:TauD/TfdA family dioxygenase [SAR86 cluster bacterium]